jgi:hypothetical protein
MAQSSWEPSSSFQLDKNIPYFMEPKVSLQFSQEPSSLSWAVWIQATLSKPFPETHFNIVLSSAPRSAESPHPFRLSNQSFVGLSHLPDVYYMFRQFN